MIFRQGDILFETFDGKIPKDLIESKTLVIALGETTGHKHQAKSGQLLVQQSRTDPMLIGFLKCEEPTEIVHDEHSTIHLGTGIYKTYRQREFPENVVAD